MSLHLSAQQKYRLCQLVFAAGFVAVLYCLGHLSPFGTPHQNKLWFGILAASLLITLPFALGFYYYRSKLRDVDTGLVQVETLSHAGEKPNLPGTGAKDKP